MKCKNCGFKLENNAKFCEKCGASQEKESQTDMNRIENTQKGLPRNKKRIMIAVALVIYLILCITVKYYVLIPTAILLIGALTIYVNRKILLKRKNRGNKAIEQCNLTDKETQKLSEYFVKKEERYISSLGNGYIMNYFVHGKLSRGFAVVSDKRVYFRGSCFSGTGKTLIKTDEERTVDIKDITGSGFIYKRYYGVLLGLFLALIVLLGGIAGSVGGTMWSGSKITNNNKHQTSIKQNIEVKENEIEELEKEIAEAEKQEELQRREIEQKYEENKKQNNGLEIYEFTSGQKEIINSLSIGMENFLQDPEIRQAYEEYVAQLISAYQNSGMRDIARKVVENPGYFVHDVWTYKDWKDGHSIYNMMKSFDSYLDSNMDFLKLDDMLTNHFYPDFWNAFRIDYESYCIAYVATQYLEDDVFVCSQASFERANNDVHYYMDELCDMIIRMGYEWKIDIDSFYNTFPADGDIYIDFLKKIAPVYMADKENWLASDIFDDVNFPDTTQLAKDYIRVNPYSTLAQSVGIYAEQSVTDENGSLVSYGSSDVLKEEKEKLSEDLELMKKRVDENVRQAEEENAGYFSLVCIASTAAGLLLTFMISCFIVFLDYLKKRKTMVQIQYAGGAIAFDVSFYAKAEIDDFQKQLRRAKDLYEQSMTSNISDVVAAVQQVASVQQLETATVQAPADELRKYAELLKEGLITQEEYDAMKKKVLGL